MVGEDTTMTMNCDHDKQNTAIYCDYSVGGENAISTTYMASGADISFVTATITKGAEMLASGNAESTGDATVTSGSAKPTGSATGTESKTDGATPTETGSGASPTSTGAACKFGLEGSALLALAGIAVFL